MAHRPRQPAAQSGLSRERIVDAAIELLDASGERGMTYRALAQKLDTGHGAIQWHVENRDALMRAATIETVRRALPEPATPETSPTLAIELLSVGLFDAIDAHPWLGPRLFATQWHPDMAQLWERLGRAVEALGVRGERRFTAVATLLGYIIGAGNQNAVNTHVIADGPRDAYLSSLATRWASLNPDEYTFVPQLTQRLADHDDREEFLAGIDIIVAGLIGPS